MAIIARSLALTCAFFVFFVSSVAVRASEKIISPSFGVEWGEPSSSFLSKFPGASVSRENSHYKILTIRGAVRESLPSNTDIFNVIISKEYGLVKMQWASTNFTDDTYGLEGKKEFEALRDAISARLGKPSDEFYRMGQQIWNDPDEFYQCLKHGIACGTWSAFWSGSESEDSNAVLQLEGLSDGVGYLSYGVEHPNWYVMNREMEAKDRSKF